MVSIYLEYADPRGAPVGWHVCAQFALVMSNPVDPTVFVTNQAHHRFTIEESDWGFTRFSELRRLCIPSDKYSRPVIENEGSTITAFVRVLDDPTGVLWHNFVNYDSKKETGFVGLKNQGATCYMNSLLQSLYCTNYFRRAVYQIPTEDDHPSESVALALQRVFFNLQNSLLPVGTTELTRSFGWKSLDSFMQHDVQEFNRVLQDKLEARMKGTVADGAITNLFVGKMKSYVKCVNVDFESSRVEDFYDIQLNVKGMNNLYDSFKDYIQVETLEGDNKYHAEGYGLQDAKKGVIFESFPPVLHLQLKRFEYDLQRDTMVKINDRHEFPYEIDLKDFVDDESNKDENWVYKLHGVLVHSGDLHGGHYFTLIKPEPEGNWLKYDDDRVTKVLDKEVLEDNFGGEMHSNVITAQGPKPQLRAMKRFTNAYMLVYIRESKVNEILAPFTNDDIPPNLRKRLEEEREANERKRRERDEQHLYLTTKIITDQTFSTYQGFDLAIFEDRNVPATELQTLKALKTMPYLEFKEQLRKHFNLGDKKFKLWMLVNRQNKTIRPDTPIPENDPYKTLDTIRIELSPRQTDLKLYLDVESENDSKYGKVEDSIMIFLKYFDVSRQTLTGICKVYVPRSVKVGDLQDIIQKEMKWPPGIPLKLYEEIKPGYIELMKPKMTLAQSELQDGDIVCFQVEISEAEIQDYEAQGMYSTPIAHYDYLQNRVQVTFRPKYKEQISENVTEFNLILSKKTNYDRMAELVGAKVKQDPLKIRFTTTQNTNGSPKSIIKRGMNQPVQDLITPGYLTENSHVILYELLDISIVELETKKSFTVTWTGINNREEGSYPFLQTKTSTINDVIDQLQQNISLSPEGSKKIKVFEIWNGKQQKEFSGLEPIGSLNDNAELFAEEIPKEELEASESDKIINVFHYSREPTRWHGIPFKFVTKPGEKFIDTKTRLQQRLNVQDKEFSKYKFSLITSHYYKQPSLIDDGDVIHDHNFAQQDALGLDHIDKSGKSNKSSERGILIR